MKEIVTPTGAGETLEVWAELRPADARSNSLKFHVVSDGAKSSPVDDPKKAPPKPPKPKKTGSAKKAKH